MKWYSFYINNKQVAPLRKTWRQSAQDAVDMGYADWIGKVLEWRSHEYSIKEVPNALVE